MNAKELYAKHRDSVVVVATEDSLGTGFFVSNPPVIITNAHVVERAGAVRLTTARGRSLQGRVIRTDRRRDLAVILPSQPLVANEIRPVELSEDETVAIGTAAYAIGHPAESAEFSMSAGIVASPSFVPKGSQIPLLQINISINWGNSGGPLFDGDGSVLGVVTRINGLADGHRLEGIAFAVPAHAVRAFIAESDTAGSDALVYCENCGRSVAKAKYCENCGTSMGESAPESVIPEKQPPAHTCSICGAVEQSSRFCARCGARRE